MKKSVCYLSLLLLGPFLPCRVRKILNRRYWWFYCENIVSWAKKIAGQRKAFDAVRLSAREVMLGSLSIDWGHELSADQIDLTSGAQDLYTSYEIYRRMADLPQLKKITLFVSVFSPGFQAERTVYCEMSLYYNHYWGIPYRFHREDYFSRRLRQLAEAEKSFEDDGVEHLDRSSEDFSLDLTQNVEELVQGHLKNNRRANGELDYLDRICSLARDRGHDLAVVIVPSRSDYHRHFQSKAFEPIRRRLLRFSGVDVIDLFSRWRSDDSSFDGACHLNQKGARVLMSNLILQRYFSRQYLRGGSVVIDRCYLVRKKR